LFGYLHKQCYSRMCETSLFQVIVGRLSHCRTVEKFTPYHPYELLNFTNEGLKLLTNFRPSNDSRLVQPYSNFRTKVREIFVDLCLSSLLKIMTLPSSNRVLIVSVLELEPPLFPSSMGSQVVALPNI
jgi:hypothetical protein